MNAKTAAKEKSPTVAPSASSAPSADAVDNTELWESGALGCDPAHAVVVPDDGSVDRALGLVVMSTRVKKKQGKQMEKAAKKAGLCLKAWLREALVEKLAKSNKGKHKGNKLKKSSKKPK